MGQSVGLPEGKLDTWRGREREERVHVIIVNIANFEFPPKNLRVQLAVYSV